MINLICDATITFMRAEIISNNVWIEVIILIAIISYLIGSVWTKVRTLTMAKFLIKKVNDIQRQLDNNIQGLFHQILRDNTSTDLALDDAKERGLLIYFNKTICNLDNLYHRCQIEGIDILKQDIIIETLISTTESVLVSSYSDQKNGTYVLPKEFIRYIVSLSDRTLLYFKSEVCKALAVDNTNDNEWDILKTHAANSFQRFVLKVVAEFIKIKPLIIKSDELDMVLNIEGIKDLIIEGFIPNAITSMKLAYRTNRGILEMLDILDLNYNKYNICYLKEEIDMASKTKEITKIADSLFHILNNYEI